MTVLRLVQAALALSLVAFVLRSFKRHRRYPLGPKGAPFLGHAFRIPSKRPWVAFWQWGQGFGGLYRISLAGKSVMIVKSFQVASDLFTKRSNVFSTKNLRVMAYLTNYDRGLAFMPFDEEFKKSRKPIEESLNIHALQALRPMHQQHGHRFVLRLLNNPHSLHMNIRRYVSSVILVYSIGYNVTTDDDHMVALAAKVSKNAARILAHGQYWVDLFPPSRFLPVWAMGPRIYRTVNKLRRDREEAVMRADLHVQRCLSDPDVPYSFVSNLLKDSPSQEVKDRILYANASIYAGGVESMIATLETFFLLMIVHPEVQTKAREEIDRIVGRDRLPTQADRPSLPYIEALLKEILRWSPPTPLTTRYLTHDEDYEDCLLPGGTNFVADLWAMTHDETAFPDPHAFRPERFLEEGYDDKDRASDPYHIVFGFGRRKCPGARFATSAIWIAMSTSLATLNISALVGPDGQKKLPVLDCEKGAMVRVIPYDYHLEPRDTTAVELLSKVEID